MNLQVPRQNNQDANGGGGGLKRVGTSSELMKFKTLTQQNHSTELAKEMNALLLTAPESEKKEITKEFNGFQRLFEKYLVDQQNAIEWEKIEPLNSSSIIAYRDIAVNEKKYEKIREDLSKLVVIKLNGGLGTSMGCTGPKSSIVVRDNLTFLDLIIKQLTNINEAFNTNVPLVLMNSFNTH
jgi:UTP--glucose-1-phosphate uridylyltransferase